MTLSYVGAGAIPRAVGLLGCRSTTHGGAEEPLWERKARRPPEWSACQWEIITRSMEGVWILREAMFRIMERESGPVSKSVRTGFRPAISVSCHGRQLDGRNKAASSDDTHDQS